MTVSLSSVGLTQTDFLTLCSFCTWSAFCFLRYHSCIWRRIGFFTRNPVGNSSTSPVLICVTHGPQSWQTGLFLVCRKWGTEQIATGLLLMTPRKWSEVIPVDAEVLFGWDVEQSAQWNSPSSIISAVELWPAINVQAGREICLIGGLKGNKSFLQCTCWIPEPEGQTQIYMTALN